MCRKTPVYKKHLDFGGAIWKWEDLEGQSPPVDTHFPIIDSPSDRLIRINEHFSTNALSRLKEWIDHSLQSGVVQVLLHKDHGYTPSVLKEITEAYSAISNRRLKFHRFGGGHDFIYFSAHEMGFLDDFGGLMDEPEYAFKSSEGRAPKIGKASVLTEDNQGKTGLDKLFFDQVWRFYNWSTLQKVFDLRETLLHALYSHWFAQYIKDVTVQNERVKWFAEELMALRLKSFCGLLDEDEQNRLAQFETDHQRNYHFGNLEKQCEVLGGREGAEVFRLTKDLLIDILRTQTKDYSGSYHYNLKDLRDRFDQLCRIIRH